MENQNRKIVITGAAGLFGQNLLIELKERGYRNLVAIDKHAHNLGIVRSLHPEVETILADLAEPGAWMDSFAGADCLVLGQAQITAKTREIFDRYTLDSTEFVLQAAKKHQIPYIVHISSSVVISVSNDDYTDTKRRQEQMVKDSGIPYCALRPTLMFGWFDPKHLGWLSRFMEKIPVFPIPGHGRYMRQPLYNRDFCKIVARCIETRPNGDIYDIVGDTRIDYIDIIYAIRRVKNLRTPIIKIPYWLFDFLLRLYALFSSRPPFTADQLKSLTAGDDFSGVDTAAVFGVKQTPFEDALRETFCDPRYSGIFVERT
jgi:uncharacterized protein YbjT (DUF2867 family)